MLPAPGEVPNLRWPIARAAGLANAIGAGVIFVYMAILPRAFAGSKALAAGRRIPGWIVIAFVAYIALSIPLGNLVGNRLALPFRTWAARGGAPSLAERRSVLRQPWLQATNGLVGWLGAAVLFGVLVGVGPGPNLLSVLVTAAGIILTGLTVWLVSFLLIERVMRPVTAIVLAGMEGERDAMTIRIRLLLTWALGTAVPFVLIAGTPLLARDATIPLIEVLVVVGLGVGALMVMASARSVADPIVEVTEAMSRVASGDLASNVAVDDASEVGRLQAGFNRMVAGLRERALLEDLFGRHVGIDVARQELERGIGLGGELRDISAVFVDIAGSTSIAHEHPATEVVTMLNDLFGAVARCASRHDGWINKFVGDAALVVVGAPRPSADHAERALRIASDLRAEVVALQATHPILDVGIGVSTGLAVAGNVGAEERYEYTVIGDPVNEAARLSDEAKRVPGRVLASAATIDAAALEGEGWQRLDELVLRGRSRPTQTYAPPSSG